MKVVYRIIAYLIALAVVLQASAIALGVFGLGSWIEGGGTLDKAAMESGTTHFAGEIGLEFHGQMGTMIIPILALLLVISSFFVKNRSAIWWSLIVLGCVAIQMFLGLFAHELYVLGAIHGIFAFAVLGTAGYAGFRIGRPVAPTAAHVASATAGRPPVGVS